MSLNAHWQNLQNMFEEELLTLERKREELKQEREDFEAMRKKIDSVHFSFPIKLDVGGKVYKTSLSTLTKEDSMLSRMFSGQGFSPEKDQDGCFFIDRPGEYFGPLLEYLQTGEFPPIEPQKLKGIVREADFFGIQSLSNILNPRVRTLSPSVSEYGIMHWLGTKKGKASWKNPHDRGAVRVTGSPCPRNAVCLGDSPLDAGWCSDARDKSFTIDLLGLVVIPKFYSLSWPGACCHPANWKLEGYNENSKWILLKNHSSDTSMKHYRTNWELDCEEGVSKFKITCTGHDQGSKLCYCFHVSAFDVFGDVMLR